MDKYFSKNNINLIIPDNIIDKIKNNVNFIQRYFKNKDNQKIREAREIALLSDNPNHFLPYSNLKLYTTGPIIEEIKLIQQQIEKKINKKFPIILINYYSKSTDKMGWHRDGGVIDDEVIILSLGGSRTFQFRDKISKNITSYNLDHGEIIHMKKYCQDHYDHRVKDHIKSNNKILEERISLVFRESNKNTFDIN